ncbi:MAG: endonuclease/exonuclease/phosphatase family protein [Candidatus Izemoplasmatales bacterium]
MKRILKIVIITVVIIITLGIGFIATLQIFEFKPEDVTVLSITDNPINSNDNYIDKNNSLTILTFNIGYASLSETEDFVMDGGQKAKMDSSDEVENNLDGISSILANNPADFYLLQEVDVDSNRSYNINQLSYFQDKLDGSSVLAYNYRCIFVPFPFNFSQMMGKVNSGIVTFSNFYAESAERHQLPGSFSWPVSLANLKRAMLITRYPIQNSDKYFVVINVHLSAYDDGTMRLQEMEALKNIMKNEFDAGNYVLVGGDFNQTFPEAVNKVEDSYEYYYDLKDENFWQAFPMEEDWFINNSFSFGVDKNTPTCRLLHQPYDTIDSSNNQYYVIDGFIVSNNLSIELTTTLNEGFVYSDHNPVKITLYFS